MTGTKRNAGFSLVELIICVAILAVVIGLVGPSIASMWKSEARKCAFNIDSLISKCRTDSMSRGFVGYDDTKTPEENKIANKVYIRIYVKDDKVYGDTYFGTAKVNTDQLGGHRAAGSLEVNGTAVNDKGVFISFDRATGRLDVFDTTQASETPPSSLGTISGNTYFTTGTFKVTIIALTGKHEVSG
ncbi:MAG: prepilin-type N-terminal cleavage/methylation domain-containing protein [Oscillospiraceae bacterium]|nr:prepilin-type N-terminal cleavage/methylation domain-containing protein [Oscillospiraceae bacterium]